MSEQILKRIHLVAVMSVVYLVQPSICESDSCEEKIKSSKLSCYECDSRINSNCSDPFDNKTFAENMTILCDKGCLKVTHVHAEANRTWTRRACQEDVINFSWLSGICLRGRRSDILMCVCTSGNLCNKASSTFRLHNFLTTAFSVFILNIASSLF